MMGRKTLIAIGGFFIAAFPCFIVGNCVPYKNYLDEVSYCSDPLYWSHYKVSISTLSNLTGAEQQARREYEYIRDNIYYNDEVLRDTGINQKLLYDCIGYAQRVACHRNIPRCKQGNDRTLCKGMCENFHRRCTVDGYNFIKRVLPETYHLYTCDGLKENHCSPASPRAALPSLLLGSIASFVLLRIFTMAISW